MQYSQHTQEEIDFVIIWVDSGDPEWQKCKRRYLHQEDSGQIDVSEIRYRDWDNLRYWFRAVETYAPWVRRVHFVTCGHVPEWLDLNVEKLHFVRHDEYIPPEFLPTFSSHPIELNLHRIEGLSERFVYFCDDFFLGAPVTPSDFFAHGLPRDYVEEHPFDFSEAELYNSIRVNDVLFASRHFDRRECRKRDWRKWYSLCDPAGAVNNMITGLLRNRNFFGLQIHHLPQAYLKQALKEVWDLEPELLRQTCLHRFRNAEDVSQCVFKFWQLLSGRFVPYNKRKNGRVFRTTEAEVDAIRAAILNESYKLICLNDAERVDLDAVKSAINAAFEQKFPHKSSFEK